MKKMKLLFVFICLVFVGCSPAFVPIVRTNAYYKPNDFAAIVEQIPANAKYIGTISIVPNDHTFFRSNDASKATHVLQKKAARAGARYVYITKMVNTNDGYWWEKDWGEGFVIEAELYY